MSLIDLPAAKAHLRVGASYPDAQVTPYLNAAEISASEFLNRKVFVDQPALDAAVTAAPASLAAAGVAYAAQIAAADEVEDEAVAENLREAANTSYRRAQTEARETFAGIVMNDLIKAGVLLILGHLFENREDVVAGVTVAQLPMGALHLLQPYRVYLGV